MEWIWIAAIIVIALIVVIRNIRVVQQSQAYVIERLGLYQGTWEPGLHFKVPVIDRVAKRVNLKEQVVDFPPQPVITKDNVTMRIDTVVFYQITDSKSYTYNVENPIMAIENLTATTLRNIIGELDLDETLVSRDTINTKLRTILDEASNKWGVKVNRVELQDIIPPADIQNSMEKQMKAERDRRAAILEAEGLKKAAILKAEGEKESQINKAEGQKQAAILVAEGLANARIKQAEAEATAIQKTIEAIQGNGQPDKYLIAVRYLDTLKQMVEGKDNKVVYMPYEATGILSSVDGIKQMLDANK